MRRVAPFAQRMSSCSLLTWMGACAGDSVTPEGKRAPTSGVSQMSEEDEKERARDYVERVKESSLAKAPQHQRAEMAAYWQSRAGLFRALARKVIRAALAGRDEADALAWSVGEFAKDLSKQAADSNQQRAFQRWTTERAGFLQTIAKQIWKEVLREEPPNDGFYVALEAHPNEDYDAGDYLGRVRIPLQWQAVMSLEDATKQARRYIESHSLGSGNWVGRAGQVARYGKPWVRISYNGRIWQGWNWDSKQEVDLTGSPLPAPRTEPAHPTTNQSFKFEVLAHGGWSSNAQRYETEEQARAAGESLFSRWTAVEKFRVVPSTDPPNQPTTEPPPEEKPAPPPADTAVEPPQPTKIGDRVNWYEPTPDGGLKRVSGLVWEIRGDGRLGIRRGDGGYSALAESQAGMVIRGNTTSPPPANLPAHQRIRKAIITREESLADDRQKSQELRDQLGVPAVSAVEPPPEEKPAPPPAASDKKILFVHVGDKPSKPTELIPSSDEEVVLRYSVEIRGQWGKKRTDGFMTVDIAKRVDPKKPLPTEILLKMMNNKLAELKVKPGAVVKLIEQPWTVSRTGVERTSLLSGRTVHTETVK